jgi:endonuclease YncB( thermonuclease family)
MSRKRKVPKFRTILSLAVFFTILGYQAVYNWFPGFFPMEAFVGQARAVDGDSLKLNGKSIRLFGIDAPELRQACHHPDDRDWPCGKLSHDALKQLVSRQTTECHPIKKDLYQRVLADCFVDGDNLAEMMVRDGWAFAYSQYSQDFVDEERRARKERIGIWQADKPEPPWLHRKRKASVWTMLTGWFGIED